ncbi:hypothetical protein HAX54_035601, partial [Datura stramonium]|nr:hypothetical protein [Datura stramonium]
DLGATTYRGAAVAWGFLLQQDSYCGWSPAVTNKENNSWIRCGGVLTAIASRLQ